MTDYTKTTDFTSKDSLPSGDSGKIIRGAEFGTEFDNIEIAVNSKSNINNPSFTGDITVTGTVDGRDIAADGTKLDTVETSADATNTANVTAAGAVMDSELTSEAAVKALNQGVATTDSPTFAAVTSTGNVTVGGTVDGRDVAADGTKLDGIEAGATADQTAAQIKTAYESNADTNAFTDADHTKLDGIEASADVTDAINVTAAGALMDSEVTNLAQVKAFDSADYATAAQGTTADNALPKSGGAMTGAITTNSTFDGRDVAADGTKLDGIEASADVTDTANVTAAGALMDSEVTNLAQVKAFSSADYATAAQGTTADSALSVANAALPKAGGALTGAVTTTSTIDGRDISVDGAKLDGIEASADVTDAANVTAAGALMDSEVTNLDQVKAFDETDYATSAQGTTADAALPRSGGAMTGPITTNSTFDGRDIATDGTKLDGIEASADVTDTTNVVASLTAGSNITISAGGVIASTASGGSQTLAQTLVLGNTTGGTDVAFGDNDKAIFGAGSDLQIYHDGVQSLIYDAGTGPLKIRASGIAINNAADTEQILQADENGAVIAFYDGSAKLATSNTGIDITGTVTADGATIDGAITVTSTVDGRDVAADGTKLDGIEVSADVTDATNVTAAGALMDSEVTNLAQVKAFDTSDYATAAQGTKADAALPKAGGTTTGLITFGLATVENKTTISGTSVSIDTTTGNMFAHTLSGNTTYTFTNSSASGSVTSFTLKVIQDSTARTITWPSSVDWEGGTAPTLSTGSGDVDVFVFFTNDGGTTYYGFTAGQDMS